MHEVLQQACKDASPRLAHILYHSARDTLVKTQSLFVSTVPVLLWTVCTGAVFGNNPDSFRRNHRLLPSNGSGFLQRLQLHCSQLYSRFALVPRRPGEVSCMNRFVTSFCRPHCQHFIRLGSTPDSRTLLASWISFLACVRWARKLWLCRWFTASP